MPKRTIVALLPEERRQILAALRRARYGSLLALHILLLCAVGRNPTEIAAVLFCSRSSVYRTVQADREGFLQLEHEGRGQLVPPVRTTGLLPTRRRSLLALLKTPARASGWCRTRWSGAPLALTLPATRGSAISAETRRRGLHEVGWVWQRAHLGATDHDPHRLARLAGLRYVFEPLTRYEAMVVADELDIHLLPKGGCAWMPTGTQRAVMTPGTNEKHYLAGGTGAGHRHPAPRQWTASNHSAVPRAVADPARCLAGPPGRAGLCCGRSRQNSSGESRHPMVG